MLFEEEKKKDEYSIHNDILDYFCLLMNKDNTFSSYDTSNTNIDKYFLYFNLCNYYSIYCDEQTKKCQLKKINDNPSVKNLKHNIDELIINFNDMEVITKQLYGNIKGIKKSNYNNSISNNEIIELSKKLNFKNNVCIGYSLKFGENAKTIQAWIEFKDKNNKKWVIDFINNILINKEAYYKLNNIKVINKISNEKIKNEKLYSFITDVLKLSEVEYLVFNKELNNEINKKKLLQK